jgi:hypothetical protein
MGWTRCAGEMTTCAARSRRLPYRPDDAWSRKGPSRRRCRAMAFVVVVGECGSLRRWLDRQDHYGRPQ